MTIDTNNKQNKTMQLLDKINNMQNICKESLLYILKNIDTTSEQYLFELAYNKRKSIYGNSIYLRGLIEFSNYCTSTCNYCGLRCKRNIDRYRLSPQLVIQQCKIAYKFGYRTFVLQSGEDPWFTKEKMIEIIKKIKKSCPKAALTLSIGEKSDEEYKAFYKAGADRYLLRHEAYNKELYNKMHPDMSYENRIRCLNTIKKLGYQTGAGFMVGVKGQTLNHIAEDLMFLFELKPDMIGIGPFMPSHDTPYENEPPGNAQLALWILALIRIIIPHSLLPLTTALVSLDRNISEKGFIAGANVIMPNITPENGENKYTLYDNKNFIDGLNPIKMKNLVNEVNKKGFDIQMTRGDVIK